MKLEKFYQTLPYEPSEYQKAVLEWVAWGKGNATCRAVAGAGKTSTLKMAAQAIEQVLGTNPSTVKVLVFNKHNEKDLREKFGRRWSSSISTIHSAGFALVGKQIRGKINVNSSKYKKVARYLGFISRKEPGRRDLTQGFDRAIKTEAPLLELIDQLRVGLLEPSVENIEMLVEHHDLEGVFNFDKLANAIAEILEEGKDRARRGEVDFTDMIWLPNQWHLKARPCSFVLTDECQDLSPAQLETVMAYGDRSSRFLFVGDPHQAIMGFAGADCDSYQKIVSRIKAIELPLSICYRCPKNHIELIDSIYPEIGINPKPEAGQGTIEMMGLNEMHKNLQIGDVVLSRKTAPLISLCIKLIAKGIAATVKGVGIGKQLNNNLDEISSLYEFSYSLFTDFVSQYQEMKLSSYRVRDNEEELSEILKDKLDAILAVYESHPEVKSIDKLKQAIENLFSDDKSPVVLSTIHRAKGLEGDRIFILDPHKLPFTWKNQQDWQLQQEENIHYVALSRAKQALFLVGDKVPNWFGGDGDSALDGDLELEAEGLGLGFDFGSEDFDEDEDLEPVWLDEQPIPELPLEDEETEPISDHADSQQLIGFEEESLKAPGEQKRDQLISEISKDPVKDGLKTLPEEVGEQKRDQLISEISKDPVEDGLEGLCRDIHEALTNQDWWWQAGKNLAEIRDRRLYRDSYKSFYSFCQDRFNKNRRLVDLWIRGAACLQNLRDAGFDPPPVESVLRPIASLPPGQQIGVWLEVLKASDRTEPTAAQVKAVKARLLQPEQKPEDTPLELDVSRAESRRSHQVSGDRQAPKSADTEIDRLKSENQELRLQLERAKEKINKLEQLLIERQPTPDRST